MTTVEETRWLTAGEQDAWIGVMGLVLRLPGLLDHQLQRDAGMGMFDYVVLSSLSMSDGRMLRMSVLADLVHGSLSRLSNVVKRLEQQQLVRREPDPEDGRFTVAILTDAGWDKVVASAPGHVDAVRHLVLDPLTAVQVRQLAEIGRRINAQLVAGLPSENACAPEQSIQQCCGSAD